MRLPQAREDELLVQELPDEVLVYDSKRHRAYCLNRPAALVWRHSDGRTTVAEMRRLLQDELGMPVDKEVVWLALDRLSRARLLRKGTAPHPRVARYSRREWARKLGKLGLVALLPMVHSIIAPTAAHAATACTVAQCEANNSNNCSGCLAAPCSGSPPGRTCTRVDNRCRCTN